jgi:hypothetical protein
LHLAYIQHQPLSPSPPGSLTWEKLQPQLGRLGFIHARPVDPGTTPQ